jgi:hypothetical protein
LFQKRSRLPPIGEISDVQRGRQKKMVSDNSVLGHLNG